MHVCTLNHSVVSNSLQPHEQQPTRLLCSWDFSRQEYQSGLPFLSPEDIPTPGIKLAPSVSPALAGGFFMLCTHTHTHTHTHRYCLFSHSVMSDSLRPYGLQPIRLLCPWDFKSKNIGLGCHFLELLKMDIDTEMREENWP